MNISNPGEIDPAISSHQEESMASEFQSAAPTDNNGYDQADRSTNLMGVADPNNAAANDLVADLQDGANSGETTPTRAVSPAASDASEVTIRPIPQLDSIDQNLNDLLWSSDVLLEMTNVVRESLKIVSIQDRDMGRLDELFQIMLAMEGSPRATTLPLIFHSRFDKLLEEFAGLGRKVLADNPQLSVLASLATSLQLKWQQRFREEYFALDAERLRNLKEVGALHDIVPKDRRRETSRMWHIVNKTPIPESDLKPGMWWLNLTCLQRDGVTDTSRERVTKRPGSLVLPLLTGTEIRGHELGVYVYRKEGQVRDLHVTLMAPAGQKVRLFRGHTLTSIFAPAAGIRYDGEYLIEQYSHKLEDESRNVFSVTLTYRATEPWAPLEELYLIPNPAQLDDWELYNRVMGDEIITREGAAKYYQLKYIEEHEEKERKARLVRQASRTQFAKYIRQYRF